MPQALRQHRRPEQCRKKLTVSTLLLLTCPLFVPGCAFRGLDDHVFSNTESRCDEPSTIRSQNSSEDDEAAHRVSAVTADYSPLRASDGSSAKRSAASAISNGVVPGFPTGHAFVQRRAKLGKPIPIRNRIESRSAEQMEPIAPQTATQNVTLSASTGSTPIQNPATPDEVSFDALGWQTVPNSSAAEFGVPIADSPRQERWPTSGHAPESRDFQNAAEEQSHDTEPLIPSSPLNSKDALPEEADSQTSKNDSSTDVLTEAPAATVDQSNSSAKEPTVLDRLRGLYAPRRDEAALERHRKANRRWTDPFGLMREREPETVDATVGATLPLASNLEASATITDSPDTATSVDDNELLLGPLIAKVEQKLAEWPRQANGRPQNEVEWRQSQTDLRLLYLMAGRSAESLRAIEAVPEKEQEFWQSMMMAMAAYRGRSDATSRTKQLTETLEYIRAASRQLQPLSTMKIRRMNFCDRIDGFGNYSVFPSSDFNAGQPLLLYAEIENYKSEVTADGQYRSEFAAMIEFFRDGETEPITSRTIRLPEIEDMCSSERTDYFQSYELTIPSLSPGRYILRLRVRDQLSLQTATTDLPFDIRSLGSTR